MMKKPIWLYALVLLAVLLSGCAAGTENSRPDYIHDDYFFLPDMEEIFNRCSNVVVVEAVESEIEDWKVLKTFFLDKEWTPCTISTVVVKQSLRGSYQEGDTVVTTQRGDGVTVRYHSVEELGGYMQPGKRYLLFLIDVTDEFKESWQEYRNEAVPYTTLRAMGQTEVDGNGDLINPTQWLTAIFGENPTVDSIQQQLQEYAQNQ